MTTNPCDVVGKWPKIIGSVNALFSPGRDAEGMRTTVDLPPAVHRRAVELAKARGQSLSATLAELTARGLSQLDEPLRISTDERSGFPVVSVGRRSSAEEVAEALNDE
jgi:hypothetical protein